MTTNTVKHTPDAREWQPIETRPQGEGVRILVYYPKIGRAMHEQEEICFASGFLSPYQHRQPSHWMPIPLPPAPQESCGRTSFSELRGK